MRVATPIAALAALALTMGLADVATAQPGPGPHAGGAHMMSPGVMGPGMMMGDGAWCGGCGHMAPGWGGQRANLNLSAADVKAYMERLLQHQGNPRVKLGSVKETDADSVTADVVTTEGGVLVQRYIFNRHTGAFQPG